jgi:hypothetical protein
MAKQVYVNKGTITIDNEELKFVKSFTLPRELGWVHEDDLNGGGVVEEVSAERTLRITYGVPKDSKEYTFSDIIKKSVIVRIEGREYQYSDCYIKSIGEPQFSGSGAATREIEIIVGRLLSKSGGTSNETVTA